jgi:hypothetical protein
MEADKFAKRIAKFHFKTRQAGVAPIKLIYFGRTQEVKINIAPSTPNKEIQ